MRGLALFAAILLSSSFSVAAQTAAASNAVVQLPSEGMTRLSSPDGRYILVGETKRTELPDECGGCFQIVATLWLEDEILHTRRLLLNPRGTAQAGWSPDGKWFYVEDRTSSDASTVYLYRAETLRRLDLADPILTSDPAARRFLHGHAYFRFNHWKNGESIVIEFNGHTDKSLVTCFELSYRVDLPGQVTKLSQREGPVAADWCHF